jgi:gentisate 1,2-dioxygenase
MSTDFHDAMKNASVSALWERENIDMGQLEETPYLWKWEELGPLLDEAVAATDMDNAERRVLVLENPSYANSPRTGASLNMVVNLQVLMPGEFARPHHHGRRHAVSDVSGRFPADSGLVLARALA